MRRALALVFVACGSSPAEVDAGADASFDATTDPFVEGGDALPPECAQVACDASAIAPELATCQGQPRQIVLDDASVIWPNFGYAVPIGHKSLVGCGGAGIAKCAKAGCATGATVLTSAEPFGRVARIGETLYWPGPNGIESCSVNGCASPASVTNTPAGGLATDGTSLFWVDGSAIRSCALPCSTTTTLWTAPLGYWVRDIVVDAANVYVAARDSGITDAGVRSLVLACAKSGCAQPNVLAATSTVALDTVALALDDTNIYFGGYAALASCPKTGCASPTMITTFPWGPRYIESIATDGVMVYWGEFDGQGGAVRTCAISGCTTPALVATTTGMPSVAVDDHAVYWSDGAPFQIGTINAASK